MRFIINNDLPYGVLIKDGVNFKVNDQTMIVIAKTVNTSKFYKLNFINLLNQVIHQFKWLVK